MDDSCPFPGLIPYKHKERLRDNHVRLLTRDGHSLADTPVYRLITVSLNDDHRYVALSYTWGPPLTTPDSEQTYNGVFRPLLLTTDDGHLAYLPVQLNLWEGIQALNARFSSEYSYWIDAVCINQTDLDERGSQVFRMAQIYSRAQSVVIWLGNGFSEESSALKLWTQVAPRIRELCEPHSPILGPGHQDNLLYRRWDSEAFRALLGGYDLTPFVRTVYDFLSQHRWFQRVWVVQEAAASIRTNAHQPIVFWKTYELDWECMLFASTFVARIEMRAKDEQGLARKISEKGLIFWHLDKIRRALQHVLACLGTGSPPKWVVLQRHQAKTDKELIGTFLHILLSSVRFLEASDPMDLVYFAYGLLSDLLSISKESLPNMPCVDYRLPLSQVYQQTVRYLLENAPLKEALGYCTPADNRANDGVKTPSWVPRFDLKHQPCFGSRHGRAGMTATGVSRPFQISGDVLTVSGVCLGTVKASALMQLFDCRNTHDYSKNTQLDVLLAVLTFLSKLPKWDALGMHRIGSLAIGLLCGSTIDFDVDSEDIFWRSAMVWDPFYHSCPEAWYIHRFVNFASILLCQSMSGQNDVHPSKGFLGSDSRVERCLRLASEISTEGCKIDYWINKERVNRLSGLSKGIEKEDQQETGEPHEEEKQQWETIIKNSKEWFIDFSTIDNAFRCKPSWPTMLLATDTGYIGRCRADVQEGDGLWLISGCNFPLVLRPCPKESEGSESKEGKMGKEGKESKDNEKDKHKTKQGFTLISPAWIRGIMAGELMTEEMLGRMSSVRIV